jgi:hypothetical protein
MKCPHCGGDISGVLASVGGQARAKKLSKAKRGEIARKAAAARWKGHKPKKEQRRGD